MSKERTFIWNKLVAPILRFFRSRRGTRINALISKHNVQSIADVGGSLHFWKESNIKIEPSQITIFNVSTGDAGDLADKTSQGDIKTIIFDGLHIPVNDDAYDMVLSNSVIEHVAHTTRSRLITEMKRVGKILVVQTPAFAFPIDPHFMIPFIHWLPKSLGYYVMKISPWRILSRPSRAVQQQYFFGTHILRKKELQSLLPDAVIHTERFIGIPKSYVAVISPTI